MNQLDLHSGEDRSVLRLGGLSLGTVSADEFDGGPAAASTIHRLRQFCRLVGSPLRLEAEFALRHDVAQSIDDPHATSVQEEGRAVFCVTDIWPGADVADIWFASDRNLRFRFRSSSWREDAAITFRCYQYDPRVARLVSVGEQPVGRAEVEFFDAALLNPFLPVLIGVTAKDGSLLGTSLLPFPSLCRGGLHYAELISEGCDVDQLSNVQAISLALLHSLLEGGAERAPLALGRIEVDLRGATGAEPIFSIDVREWLETVMDIGCSPARAADIENPEVRTFLVERLAAPAIATSWRSKSWTHSGRGGHALSISFDALPSLHALVAAGNSLSPRKGVTIGGFAVAKSGTASPSWVAFLPPMGESILALQPRHSVVGIPFVRCLEEACDAATAPTWPLAIRFVDFNLAESKAALLMPVAPDVSGPLLCQEPPEGTSITVLIPTSGVGDDGFVTLVESLRLQTVSDRLDIVVILEASGREARTEIEGALSRHFDGRHQIISCSDGDLRARLDHVLDLVRGEYLLLAQSNVVLHDPRTLETLATIVAQDSVASAGCMLVRPGLGRKEPDIVCRSGGHFQTLPIEGASSGEELSEFECFELFPLATYPVAANSWTLQMMRTETPRMLGGFASAPEGGMDLAVRAFDAGMVHLCTTVVSAGLRLDVPSPATPSDSAPIGNGYPSRSASVPAIRKLNG